MAATKKLITVWVVRNKTTGLYYAGDGRWSEGKWIARCTAEDRDDADEMDDADLRLTFPDGLPAGWEQVQISQFESRR